MPTSPDDNHVSLKEHVNQRFDDQEKAIRAALASAEKAVDKAEDGAEKWRNSANEWRGAMSDRERDFLTRKEFYAIVGTAVAVISLIFAFRH
jgi:hypothetical protein